MVAGRIELHRKVVVLSGAVAMAVAAACLLSVGGLLPAGGGLAIVLAVLVPYVVLLGGTERPWDELKLPNRWSAWITAAIVEEESELEKAIHPGRGTAGDALMAGGALVVVIVASVAMERGATSLGVHFGVAEIIVGGLVLAAVTSLPNAVSAIYLARRGRGAATLSTALNSNSLNVMAGLLIPAVVIGLAKPSGSGLLVSSWYVGLTALTLALAYAGHGLGAPLAGYHRGLRRIRARAPRRQLTLRYWRSLTQRGAGVVVLRRPDPPGPPPRPAVRRRPGAQGSVSARTGPASRHGSAREVRSRGPGRPIRSTPQIRPPSSTRASWSSRIMGRSAFPASNRAPRRSSRSTSSPTHSFDHLVGGCTRRRQFCDVVDQVDVISLLGGGRVVMSIAGGQLSHDDANDEEAHCHLYVRPMGDGELLVGAGQEEVEPQRGRDRGHEPRDPVAQRGDGHDDGDQNQCRSGVGETRSEWHENRSHAERQDHRCDEGYLVSVKPDRVHGTSLRSVSPFFHDSLLTGSAPGNRLDDPGGPGAGDGNQQHGTGESELQPW